MSELSFRYKQSLYEQSINNKFLQLLNTNKQIQSIKDKQILPSIPLSAFNTLNNGLPEIGKQKMKMKMKRSMSESKFKYKNEKEKRQNMSKGKDKIEDDVGIIGNKFKIERIQSESILQSNNKSNFGIAKNMIKIRTKSIQSSHKQHRNSIQKSQNKRQRKGSQKLQTNLYPYGPTSVKNLTPIQITPQKFKIMDFPVSTTHNSIKTNKITNNKTLQQINNQAMQSIMLNVKFGKIQQNISYKNYLKRQVTPNPTLIIQKLSKWIQKYKIKSGLLYTKNLHIIFSRKQIPNNMILAQFTNYQQLKKQLTGIIPGLQYYDENNKQNSQSMAATKIQSVFKMIIQRKYAKKLKSLMNKVKIIQKNWRLCLQSKKGKQKILQRINKKIQLAKQLSNKFMKNWQFIKTSPRVQIHICSIAVQQFKRLSIQDLQQRQIAQLTRIFKAVQTDCTIIYVVPYNFSNQILRYYQRIFAFGNMAQKFRDKLFIISVQKILNKISPHLTTVSALLYDSQNMRKIKQLIKDKQTKVMGQTCAYIIPSYPSNQYINLSAQLHIPIFSSSQSLCKLYSTKSGHYQFLKQLQQNLADKCPFLLPKTIYDIYSEKQLINILAILIQKYSHIKKWLLKIDDQINGRGLAIFNVDSLVFLKQIRQNYQKLKNNENQNILAQQQQKQFKITDQQMIKLIADQLKVKLKLRLKILHKNVYPNYESYISHFLTRGGVIQAGIQSCSNTNSINPIPTKPIQHSISFKIQPNGQFEIIGSYSRLQLGYKAISSTIQYPSSLQIDNEKIIRALYRYIWGKHKMYGYFTIDCLYSYTKQKLKNGQGELYIIGMDLFLNQKTSSIFVPQLICQLKYEKQLNIFYSNKIQASQQQNVKKFKTQSQISVLSEHNINNTQNNEEKSALFQQNKQKRKQIHCIYCPFIRIKNLPQISIFFKQCKFGNISFDIKNKIGTLFLLQGGLEQGCFGFICISDAKQKLYQQTLKLVQFLSKEFREKNNKIGSKTKNHLDQIGQLRGFLLNVLRRNNKEERKFKKQQYNLQYIF